MDGWIKKILQHIRSNVGNPEARANFQDIEDMIGIPDAANSNLDDILRTGYDSSGQSANIDGSAVERLESLQAALSVVAAGAGGGFEVDGAPGLVTALGTTGAVVTDSATSVLGAIGANNADNAFASGSVAANEDGSVLERLEQIQEATNIGTGTSLAANSSVVDAIGHSGSADLDTGVMASIQDYVETGFSSSGTTVNEDGAVLERLEGLLQENNLRDLFFLADYDDFDVADADANTERWDVGYLNGAEGGSANINTTTAGQLRVSLDPDATPTASGYGVWLAQPITNKYFSAVVDLDVSSFGTPNISWATLGMRVSPTTYDANNVVYAQRQESSGGVLNRIAVGAIFNSVSQTEQYFTTTDTSVAFKIERWDNVWRCFYSLSQSPDFVWVLLAQYEDPSEFMDAQQSVYLDAYSPGNADAQTAVGDFDNFKVFEGVKGLSQEITGDYDSSAVAADEDGSLAERLEQIQEAVNRGAGSSLPAGKSIVDIVGASYLDAGGAFQADSVSDDLRTLGQYLIDGTAGAEAGTVLPAGKSLRDVIGTAYVDAGGAFGVDSVADDFRTLGRYIADGTEGSEAGTALPAGKSIVDVTTGGDYVDAAGGFQTENVRDDLRTIGQYLIDGTAGGEAGTVLPVGKSLYNILGTAYVDAGGGFGTDSVVSDLGVIEGLIDSTEAAGPYSYLDAGGEQDVYEELVVTRRRVWVEFSNRNMTQTGTFRIYRKVDGASYDLWVSEAVLVAAGSDRAFDAEFTTNQHWKLTYQENVDEAAARAIPYNVIVQVVE